MSERLGDPGSKLPSMHTSNELEAYGFSLAVTYRGGPDGATWELIPYTSLGVTALYNKGLNTATSSLLDREEEQKDSPSGNT